MRRLLIALALALLGAIHVWGQAGIPGGTINSYTVATLPASPGVGTLAIVTDANGTSCSTGGSTTKNLCRYNGSGWDLVSGAAGGTVYPGAGVANSTGSGWGTSFTVGTAASNLVQLNVSAQLPAVSGALLTNLACAGLPALTGDATTTAGSCATTVGKINGTSLAGLATGILKNTTTTGVPSIAVAGDFPTLNQSTTGTAATITGALILANTPLTTNGDLFTVSGGALARLATGTSTQVLHGGNTWAQVSLATDVTGNLPVANLNSGTSADSNHFWRGDATWGTAVTSIATTGPITGGTITGAGTIACATCVTAVTPGAGIAHFAGATQAVTSSAIVLADISSGILQGTDSNLLTSGTVSVTGSTLCLDSNGGATTVGCTSGGGGTISGLTTGYLPKATSATSLTANSAIDDGVTTAGTVTSSEPIAAPSVSLSGTCNTGTAGCAILTNGTAPSSFTANSIVIFAPTTIATGYGWKLPAAAGTGLIRGDNSSLTVTISQAELSGDCTTSGSNAVTCTKTNGSAFVASATTDTTNASNISSGLLGVAEGGLGVGTLTIHGVLIGQTTAAVHVTAAGTAGQCLTSNGASLDPTYQTCGTGAGVSSFTGDGTIITNSASTGGVTLTIAGASGGIPYFSSASAWASSGLLTNHGVILGGGAAGAPTSTAAGATNAPLIGQGGAANPIFSTILYLTSLTSGGAVCGTSTTQLASSTLLVTNALVVGGGAGACPGTGNGDFTYATHTLTAGASGLVDFSAMTTTTGLKIPTGAGAVPIADGFIANNSANHTLVWGSNGTTMVGAIAATGTGTLTNCGSSNQVVSSVSSLAVPGCSALTLASAQFANQGTTTTVLHGNAAGNPSFGSVALATDVTGTLPNGDESTNTVTATAAAAAAKQVCTASGATKTCSYVDFPEVLDIPAANCNNATAGAGWSIGASGTVTCRAGTNNLGGFISITDTASSFATFQVVIPEDWDTGTNPYIRFQLASTDATNAHTIIPSIQVACYKGDGSTTDDVAPNAAHSLSTTTLNGNANRFWSTSNVQMNSTDVTGCVAGAIMQITVGRATDTATNAEFYSATVTIPRLITVQAN